MFTQSTFNEQFNQFTPDVFRDPLFGELRVFIDTKRECWFIGSEVASRFGYVNPHKAIQDHVPSELIQQVPNLNLTNREVQVGHGGSRRQMLLIHERGLYALAGKSQLPGAIAFYEWVCEQIQDMRKYGVAMSQHLIDVIEFDPEQLWRIAKQREEENMRLEQENRNLQQQNNRLQQQNQSLRIENRGLGNRVSSLGHHIEILNNRRQMSQDYFDDKVRDLRDSLDEFLDR